MKKHHLFFSLSFIILALIGCKGSNNTHSNFCHGATAQSYNPNFKIWCPTVSSNYLPVKYGCPPAGKAITPPISWSGLPEGTTHLTIIVEDATCTYMCNDCCKYIHWVLEIPLEEVKGGSVISEKGIKEGAGNLPAVMKYAKMNGSNKQGYMHFCPPKHQTHAIVYKAIAYDKSGMGKKTLGRSQSVPMLYSLKR